MRDEDFGAAKLSRRAFVGGLLAVGATPAFASAPAILIGAGNYRSLNIHVSRTGESINSVYWLEGHYISEALSQISYLLRDWREEEVKQIAPATLDIMAATHRMLECRDPFEVISAYRTAKTNAMLRSRSRAVARNSYHVKAMAVDLRIKSRSVRQVSGAALALNAGGVGKYSRAEFVHLDSGPVRDWGR